MDIFENFARRKSVREYTGEKLDQVDLEIILAAAYRSPVAMGRFEDMHLSVIRNRSIHQAIEANLSEVVGEKRTPLYQAPVLIVVSVKPAGDTVANNEYSSAAMIVHNMALAATALRLGSCDIWGAIVAASKNPELVARLQLPEGFVPCCGIVIGPTDYDFPVRELVPQRFQTAFLED